MIDVGTAVDVPSLYATHRLPLVGLAILLVGDQAGAEDVVQDAFIGLHRNHDKIRDPQAAIGYLRTSTRPQRSAASIVIELLAEPRNIAAGWDVI